MSKKLFIQTPLQKEWIEKLLKYESMFKSYSNEIDKESRFPYENVQKLIDIGYTRLPLTKEYGGEGISVTDMVLFQETIASFDGATALAIGWHQGTIGELYENKNWSSSKLTSFADEVMNGALVNRAVSEAQTGSPTRGGRPGTYAIMKDGYWSVSGQKTFTTMSPVLSHFLVAAWIEEKEGIGYFLIERDTKGLSIEKTWDVLSMRGTESHDLILDQVKVSEENFVEFNQRNPLNGWILHIPACYLGIAQAARDYAVKFALEYSPNSIKGTISQLPNVQSLIGEIELELMNARHFLYSVANSYDDHSKRPYITNELGAAKHIVTNSAIRIVDKAMRIAGIKSLQLSNPLQRYYRDIRAGLHNPPMDDMTISKLAQNALKN